MPVALVMQCIGMRRRKMSNGCSSPRRRFPYYSEGYPRRSRLRMGVEEGVNREKIDF